MFRVKGQTMRTKDVELQWDQTLQFHFCPLKN